MIFPMILNFKYFYQLRITNYIFAGSWLSLNFIGNWMVYFGTSEDIDHTLYIYSLSDFMITFSNAFLLLMIAGIRWDKFPKWIYALLIYNFLAGVTGMIVTLVTNDTIFIGVHPISQYFFPFSVVLTQCVILYAMLSGDIVRKNKRVMFARNLWIATSSIHLLAQSLNLGANLLQIPFEDWPLWFFYIVVIGVTVSGLLILVNHIFFPEAVLITTTAYHKAAGLYATIGKKEKLIPDIGIGAIISYFESAKQLVDANINE
ncbi:MAG: hypothetical protein GPJ54_00485 [Candidatus Heimdallarchaeota archaeon]|nr:hypothetical protein [Candidatus Heimdallarchaeota archaeon]